MKRRELIALLGSATVLWPFAAASQQPAKIWRIAYLSPAATFNPVDEAFDESLRQLGCERDRNVTIEYRYTGGRGDNEAPLVTELAGLGVDLFVVWGPSLALAATQAAPQTPVVFMVTDTDPIQAGLVSNFAHPGGSITGISSPNVQVIAKRLELLKEAVPTLTQVAVLFSTEPRTTIARDAFAKAARTFSIKVDEIEVGAPPAIEAAIRSVKDRGAQGLYVWPTGFAFSFAKQISEAANAMRLSSICSHKEGVLAGCLLI